MKVYGVLFAVVEDALYKSGDSADGTVAGADHSQVNHLILNKIEII